jgi:hypothetical protein
MALVFFIYKERGKLPPHSSPAPPIVKPALNGFHTLHTQRPGLPCIWHKPPIFVEILKAPQ